MLEEAVNDYIKLRNDPNGLLVTHGILPTEWYSPKHHLLRHYPEWVNPRGFCHFVQQIGLSLCINCTRSISRRAIKGPSSLHFSSRTSGEHPHSRGMKRASLRRIFLEKRSRMSGRSRRYRGGPRRGRDGRRPLEFLATARVSRTVPDC